MKKIYLFISMFLFFSFLIFFLGNSFFGDSKIEKNNKIEKKYIEPSFSKNEQISESKKLSNEQKNKITIALKSAYNIDFIYIPNSLKGTISQYTNSFKTILNSKEMIGKVDNLKVEYYKEKNDVRGKMKNYTIKLFGIKDLNVNEFNAVGIHEFAHYVDLYYLEKKVFTDVSEYFYGISWESTKIIKAGLIQNDFVSGYAMTNKYEDFAESMTYFILHNEDFLIKAKKSKILEEKYSFFTKFLFKKGSFEGTTFSLLNAKMKEYYWDITKINFSLEKLLQFLKK